MGKQRFSRRQALRLGALGVLGALTDLALPEWATAWGSVWATNSHEYILKQAYPALERDPAFEGVDFPKLADIIPWEGQEALYGKGKGPDSGGATKFSQHYYNPRLQQNGKGKAYHTADGKPAGNYTNFGDAPMTAALYFKKLCAGLAKGKATPKDAAWAAHFIGDVWVPYHIVGCHFLDLVYLEEAMENLPEEVFGSTVLCYLSPFMDPTALKRCIRNFRLARSNDDKIDWFDPWYWNGRGFMTDTTSSHVAWEGAVYPGHQPVPNPAYHKGWQNPEPSFEHNDLALAQEVERFAKTCAETTASNLERFFNTPQLALVESVNSVYTIWRASFSGLRVEITEAVLDEDVSPPMRHVSVALENRATAPAKNARARLRIEAPEPLPKVQELEVPLLAAGGRKVIAQAWSWADMHPGQQVGVTVELIASLPIPDAQFATASAPMTAKKQGCWPRTYQGEVVVFVYAWGINPAIQDYQEGGGMGPASAHGIYEAPGRATAIIGAPDASGVGSVEFTLECFTLPVVRDRDIHHQQTETPVTVSYRGTYKAPTDDYRHWDVKIIDGDMEYVRGTSRDAGTTIDCAVKTKPRDAAGNPVVLRLEVRSSSEDKGIPPLPCGA